MRKRIDHGNNALFESFQVITQQRSDDQLQGLIAATVAAIIFLAPFMWGPRLFETYLESKGQLLQEAPEVCKDVDSRALMVLSSLLATLIALNKKDQTPTDKHD